MLRFVIMLRGGANTISTVLCLNLYAGWGVCVFGIVTSYLTGYSEYVADIARNKLDEDIAHYIRTEDMLRHLAHAIETAPKKRGETYPRDAIEALTTAERVVREHRHNMEHVRAIYDDKVHNAS